MKLYVAGPMTGLPEHNYPAFRAAATELRAAGHDVVDPSEAGQVDGWEWSDYMVRGLTSLIRCDGIALLDGWVASRGTQIEVRVALALELDIRVLADWLTLERAA